jgi:hypothetical protein
LASAPEEPGYRIIRNKVKTGPGNYHVTLSTDKLFIPEEMISATVTKPGEKQADKVIPKVI